MDLEETIKYCDGLPFLHKGRVEYHEEVSVAWMAKYELKTDKGCWIIFHIYGHIEFAIIKDKFSRHLSFEKFFEELSIEGKENILFHLDLFRDRV
jgi:hypothetical protein